MLSRIRYILRETLDSFRRNATLTAAAIITAAISLLLVGLTFLSQRGFDNLLQQWEGGVEVIVFMNSTATQEQLDFVGLNLDQQEVIAEWRYCDVQCTLSDADRIFAADPSTRALLNESNIGSQYKLVPADDVEPALLGLLRDTFETLPAVTRVEFAEDQISLISQLKGFFGFRMVLLSMFLLFAAVLLIWNTIRTAIFARRREIEVMKLVGATDWFIRLPFMLEGLLHGIIGGSLASAGLLVWNNQWTSGVREFPTGSGFSSVVVTDGYQWTVVMIIVGIGALAGAIGSGIAASRFLDV